MRLLPDKNLLAEMGMYELMVIRMIENLSQP